MTSNGTSKKSLIVRNVFSNWAGLLINLVVTFFLSPFLVHSLGDSMYGLWVLILSVTGYMGLLDAGLRVSIVRFVSRFDATSDLEQLHKAVFTSLLIYGALAILVFLGGIFIALNFQHFFSVAPELVPTARIVAVIVGANLALTFPLSVFSGFLAGLQRFDLTNKVDIAVLLIRSIVIVIFVSQGFGIVALGIIHLLSQAVSGAILFFLARTQQTPIHLHPRYASWTSLKTLYSYSAFIFLNNLAMLLLFRSGAAVVGIFINSASVTYYSIADSLTHYLGKIVGSMTQVLQPHASAQEAKAEFEGIRTSVILGTKLCMLLSLPIGAVFLISGDQFITSWMGQSYAVVAAPLLSVLTVSRLAWLSQSATGNILLGIGRHKALTSINVATGISCLIGAVVGIKSWDLLGMVVGSAVPLVLIQGIVLPLYTCHTLRIEKGVYVLEAFFKPAIATVPFALVLLSLKQTPLSAGLVGFFGEILLSLPVFLFSAYFLCFSPSERHSYRKAVASLWQPALRKAR